MLVATLLLLLGLANADLDNYLRRDCKDTSATIPPFKELNRRRLAEVVAEEENEFQKFMNGQKDFAEWTNCFADGIVFNLEGVIVKSFDVAARILTRAAGLVKDGSYKIVDPPKYTHPVNPKSGVRDTIQVDECIEEQIKDLSKEFPVTDTYCLTKKYVFDSQGKIKELSITDTRDMIERGIDIVLHQGGSNAQAPGNLYGLNNYNVADNSEFMFLLKILIGVFSVFAGLLVLVVVGLCANIIMSNKSTKGSYKSVNYSSSE